MSYYSYAEGDYPTASTLVTLYKIIPVAQHDSSWSLSILII